MSLSETACRNARAREKPYKIRDGDGMYLLVPTSGSRLWRLDYRFDGKRKTLALGVYPMIGLAEARERRLTARTWLAKGVDPAKAGEVDVDNSFEDVARAWFEGQRAKWVDGYADRVWSRLVGDVFPALGERSVDAIEAPEVLKALRAIEGRGAFETAKRVGQYVGQVFRYAIATGMVRRDPTADLRGALHASPRKKRRASVKTRDIPDFITRLRRYQGEEQTRLAVEFIMHTFVRTSELRLARRQEFEDLGGAAPLWRIPAERMKMTREHLVPLTPQSVVLLHRLLDLARGSDLLLPSDTGKGVVSENTMLYALYRIGYHGRATIHGLRGTASTVLNEQGFNQDWIERQLAHVPGDSVRAAYNSAEWLAERRTMMLWYSDFLTRQGEIGMLLSQ
ncbi:MAG: integrase arm-type DNA-binding domain-containing protein [Caulobacter sp.]|nr:integrase arm-type DNA-binding domain-containing protein [Caulobacter sp.]